MIGFAITLIVVTLDVPATFAGLMSAMRGSLAFGVCFALLALVWYRHYVFFRRYGLSDRTTVLLNGILLFTILLYVFPLKFLFTLVLGGTVGGGRRPTIEFHEIPLLFTVYGVGFVAIFLSFAALYIHAWRRRAALELNAIERFDTQWAIVDNLLYVVVGALSIAIANFAPVGYLHLSGWCYALLGVTGFSHGLIGGIVRERVARSAQRDAPA